MGELYWRKSENSDEYLMKWRHVVILKCVYLLYDEKQKKLTFEKYILLYLLCD